MEKTTELDAKRMVRVLRGKTATKKEVASLIKMSYKEAWRSQYERGAEDNGYFEKVNNALAGTAPLQTKIDNAKKALE